MPSWLVRQLRSINGITARIQDDTLEVSVSGGRSARFVVEAKARLSLEGAGAVVRDAQASSSQILVATRSLTDEARAVLRTNGISWVERDTNACWIQGPGILIERSPDPARPDRGSSPELPRATTLQKKSGVIAETLLLFYQHDEIKVRDVAEKAGTAVGLASHVLQRLELEDVVAAQGVHAHKQRHLENAARLLDLWSEEEQVDNWSRVGLYVWSQTTGALYSRLDDLTKTGIRWALGHISAANRYAPTLTREPHPEIWIPADVPPDRIADILDGEIVESGANLTVWQCPDDSPLHHAESQDSGDENQSPRVSRYRAYVEAYRRGGRSQDVATRVREEINLSAPRPTS